MFILQSLAEVAGLLSAGLIMVFSLAQAWLAVLYMRNKQQDKIETPMPPKAWSGKLPTVLVQLPIYNEQYVVERLLHNIAKIDYPKDKLTIQLLDDSTDETVEIAAKVIAKLRKQGINIVHVRRPDRTGFKAGALAYGLKLDKSEFVAIFDADFLPRPDFVKSVLAYFTDKKVGMVQTRWEHLNADYSIITRMMAFAIDNHFSVEHGGRQASDSFINFNGTGGMWRRKTIDEAGGWRSDTLTEDLDLSFRSQILGWKFIFTERITTPSELPVEMSAVRSQQFRWTKGAAETGRITLSNLWASDARFYTKLVGSFHMLNSFVFLGLFVFGLVAAIYPFLGSPYFRFFSTTFNVLVGLAMLANFFTYWTSRRSGDFSAAAHAPWNVLYTTITFMAMATGLCMHCSRAVVQGLFGKATPFVRTPKLNVTHRTAEVKSKQAYKPKSLPLVALLEGLLAIIFLLLLLTCYGTPAATFAGIYLFYGAGFAVVAYLSLKEATFG